MFLDDGCNVHLAAEIKKHVNTPVATIGALSDPGLMEEILASGKADVVELGRELLAIQIFQTRSVQDTRTKRENVCAASPVFPVS